MSPTTQQLAVAIAEPRLAGLRRASVFSGLPADPSGVSALLAEGREFTATQDGAFEADDPNGIWRWWPSLDRAARLSRYSNELSPAETTLVPARLDLAAAVDRLLELGHWCSELRFLLPAGWSEPIPLRRAVTELRDAQVRGVGGYWSDPSEGVVYAELFAVGEVWASRPLDAEKWLLVCSGLADE